MSVNQNITLALKEPGLSNNVQGAMRFLREKRIESIESKDDWEMIRAFGDALRQYSINNLAPLLEQLEAKCTENDIQVHWAESAEEAQKLVLEIAKAEDAKHLVKGKSMVSEEIELNQFLANYGIESLESDMGEYIVQLANERPSHIIMPAIHKTQTEIAELFSRKLKKSADPNDVDALIGIGREVLRQYFKDADLGISGVNFAIAETGTLCLVENEGNGRMSTTAPRTHIALMGLEKVIPSLEDLPYLLHLLTRSATGQKITTYLNLINGPRKSGEKDGPKAVHLIIIDNGRSSMIDSPLYQETLKCIRCGACMNHCPVYSRVGGHAYGTTYPGPIGQAFTPHIDKNTLEADLVSACSLNAACEEACPVKVPLPSLIRSLRQDLASKQTHSQIEKLIWTLWKLIHKHSFLYAIASQMFKLPGINKLIVPTAWTTNRNYPQAAKKSLHQLMKERNR